MYSLWKNYLFLNYMRITTYANYFNRGILLWGDTEIACQGKTNHLFIHVEKIYWATILYLVLDVLGLGH